MPGYDRTKAKEKLRDRARTTYERSSSGSKVIKSDVPQWKCSEGKHKIDILPFLAGKHHPELKAGDPDYFYELMIHFGVGAGDEGFLCPRMFKEDCPICEHRKELDQAGELDADLKKELRPKTYSLYNIICYDTPDEQKKGVQVWLVSSFFMQQKLKAIMQDDSGEIINFYEPDMQEGKSVRFERKGSGAGNTSFLGHKFVDRKYEISNKLLGSTYSLDEIVIIPTYEDIEKAFYGKKGKPGEGPEEPEDAGEDEDVKDDIVKEVDVTEDEIREMSRKDLKKLIEDRELGIDPDDYETKDELIEAVIIELSTSGHDGDEDEGEPKCPNKKGTFGKSFDAFDDCPDCDLFDDCSDAHDKTKKAPKEQEKSSKGLKRRNK